MIRQAQVLSKAPPGGRCTLYAGYLQRLAEGLGLEAEVVLTAYSDPHGQGFPALLLDGQPVQPADGVVLSPEDLIAALREADCPVADQEALAQSLNACLEAFLDAAGE